METYSLDEIHKNVKLTDKKKKVKLGPPMFNFAEQKMKLSRELLPEITNLVDEEEVGKEEVDKEVKRKTEEEKERIRGFYKRIEHEDDFIQNILSYKGENKIKVFNCDFIDVDKTNIKDVDLFLYDGDHSFESTKLAVEYFADTFAEECILIFDDANWDGVINGAEAGIQKVGLTIQYEKKMLNKVEDERMWWNGLYIVVVKK
jgi:hypothetical protein